MQLKVADAAGVGATRNRYQPLVLEKRKLPAFAAPSPEVFNIGPVSSWNAGVVFARLLRVYFFTTRIIIRS
jgi:hypothetical protein